MIGLCERSLKRCNPSSEIELLIPTDEQVHVIRHDHVSSNCDIEFNGSPSKLNKG